LAEKTTPPGRRTKTGDDERFEAFLQKQFGELKRELQRYSPGAAGKEGKLLELPRVHQTKTGKGSWKYGIAAAALVAVAVPMVIQLNQKKTEFAVSTVAPAATAERKVTGGLEQDKDRQTKSARRDAPIVSADADELEAKTTRDYRSNPAKIQKKTKPNRMADQLAGEKNDRNLKASREETTPDVLAMDKLDGINNEQENRTTSNAVRDTDKDRFFNKKEEAKAPRVAAAGKSGYTQADEAPAAARPAAPAASPAPMAKSRSVTPATEASGGDAKMAQAETPTEVAAMQRSAAVDDAKSRMKKQEINEGEKAEMEKLWKEFEKDPKSFNQDKKRSARLRALLSRHNEKSRAKRMRAVEVAH
jgi:hypothetical protein